MAAKLTTEARQALRWIAEAEVMVPQVDNDSAAALMRHGLAEVGPSERNPRLSVWRLTDAGRAALEPGAAAVVAVRPPAPIAPTDGTGINNRAALASIRCPECAGAMAMWADEAPRLRCLTDDCEASVDLDQARELAAGWAVAVRWMEATAAVLDGEG